MKSRESDIDRSVLQAALDGIGLALSAMLLVCITVYAWGFNRHSLVARLFSPIMSVDMIGHVEPELWFLEDNGTFTHAINDEHSRRIYENSGGPAGSLRRINVRMVAVTDTHGLWAPTGTQRKVWLLNADAMVFGDEEEKYEAIAPCVLSQAYAIWKQNPELRPYVELLEAKGYIETLPSHGVAGPWRTNWWGYVVNALTLIAIGVLTSPLWWNRVWKWRARRRESPAMPAH